MSTSKDVNCSNKIENDSEKARFPELLKSVPLPKNFSFVNPKK